MRSPHTLLRIDGAMGSVIWAQVLTAGVFVASRQFGLPWWTTLSCCLSTVLAVFGRWRGRSPLRWGTAAARFCVNRIRPPPQHARVPQAAAVLEIIAGAGPSTVPLPVLRNFMHRKDIRLSSVDIVTSGKRSATPGHIACGYDRLPGTRSAAAARTTWVVLGLDPTMNTAAIARRGGGATGMQRCAALTSKRLQHALRSAGCHSRRLSPGDASRVCAALLHDGDEVPIRENWSSTSTSVGNGSARAIRPQHLSTQTVEGVWARPALETTVTVRLRARGDHRTSLQALVRHVGAQHDHRLDRGTATLNGQQYGSMLAALPTGARALERLTHGVAMDDGELAGLHLPVAGAGQVIGVDSFGKPVTARLFGPGVRRVLVRAEPFVAKQVVLRAVAIGALAVVHTARPHIWEHLARSVADVNRLCVGDRNFFDPRRTLVVVDGTAPAQSPAGSTVLHLGAGCAGPYCVTVEQPGEHGDRLLIAAGEHRTGARLITPREELSYLEI